MSHQSLDVTLSASPSSKRVFIPDWRLEVELVKMNGKQRYLWKAVVAEYYRLTSGISEIAASNGDKFTFF